MGNRSVKIGDRMNYTLSRKSWQNCPVTDVQDEFIRAVNDKGAIGLFYYDQFELANDNTSPVRTVTRREIMPGVYGRVKVTPPEDNDNGVGIEFVQRNDPAYKAEFPALNAAELRSAARIFNEIADVLDEQSAETKDAA